MKVWGPHGWNVRAIALTDHVIKIQISVLEIVYGPTIFFAKLALFLLFLRIFSCNRWTRNAIYFGIIVNLIFNTISTLVFGIQCVRKPGQSWIETASAERCRDMNRMNYVQGGFGIVSDLYIFILPMPVIWRLHMQLRRKIAVCGIFLTGLIAILASVLGCYYRVLSALSPDLAWNEPPALGLALVEMSVGVICGSVPHLSPIVRRYKPKMSNFGSLFHSLFRSSKSRSKKSSGLPLHDVQQLGSNPSAMPKGQIETKVLGSIQGEGKFFKSGAFSRMWEHRTATENSVSTTMFDDGDATKRDYYEGAEGHASKRLPK
ncbi:hypothetical protein JMJ35_000840 [Cladonia borealis]|uniref:Rhodopsin domain-containing protein n=1 Tax=Cladonia borealis TaxID=184061 RepID=A0AA39V4Y2_9LECA|nr:hypothetical protein JMJ35_000840 [Cladonia borealis]